MAGGVSRPSPVSTGLACRCPRCGRGGLFSGFLTLVERCEICQLDLRAADSGDGPAVFVIFIVLAIAVPFAFSIWTWFGWPAWLVMLLTSVLVLGGSLGLLRPAKAILIALQFRHRPQDSFRQNGGSSRGVGDH
ncbi:DUF983 domain-containing protein [Dongia soli]|uniref:DUF983 domain-containing protein n=1 Tax=Dongia soli TaxID=600628 RepID=A0ABU5EDM5_9PROT|nr:DUF983 domain-containing protein [Dongia soli]MDY0883971.1 DUF983 domain-containing protein [Dongia soli]